MYDHILMFDDESAAREALAPLGYGRQDEQGAWVWDGSRVSPGVKLVTADAVWDRANPMAPVLVTPQQSVAGYTAVIAAPEVSDGLKSLNVPMLIFDTAEAGTGSPFVAHAAGVDLGQLSSIRRLEPSSAGRTYNFAQVAQLIDDTSKVNAEKEAYKKRVDDDAEEIRLRYLTPGAGMAMTYAEKRDQANAVHALGESVVNGMSISEQVEQFPTLAASIGLEAPTLWACALIVIAKSEAWATLSYAIERIRLLGKKAISDASDAASARAAYEAIEWKV